MSTETGRTLAGAEYREDDTGYGTWYLKGRRLVQCDNDCLAYDGVDLNMPAEVLDAYLHWRSHSYLGGCSHAR